MSIITFGYWDVRSLGEPIRYLLHYKKVKFVDKRYRFGEEEWQKDKYSLGLDFPNLPYYIEGDLKLTQSTTILRYLAEKYGLDGKTEDQKLQVSFMEQQILDMRFRITIVVKDDHFDLFKADFKEYIPVIIKQFSQFLGDKKFLIGDEITYVDFMAYDMFDFVRMLIPGVLNDLPNLKAYQERIKNLPELHEYLQSSTYKRWPIFGPKANFGFKGEEPKEE